MGASFFQQLLLLLVLLQNAALAVLLKSCWCHCCRNCDGLKGWVLEPCCDIFSCLVAAFLLCGEEQEDLNTAVCLHNLEGIRLFFSGRANKTSFQRFEIISCSQNFTGLPLSQLYSDHDEAAWIFLLSRVLDCFYLCGEIIGTSLKLVFPLSLVWLTWHAFMIPWHMKINICVDLPLSQEGLEISMSCFTKLWVYLFFKDIT